MVIAFYFHDTYSDIGLTRESLQFLVQSQRYDYSRNGIERFLLDSDPMERFRVFFGFVTIFSGCCIGLVWYQPAKIVRACGESGTDE